MSDAGRFQGQQLVEGRPERVEVGARPIEITLPDAVYLTVRGEVLADIEGDELEVAFIGGDDTVAVFTEVADLAHYCRTATGHRLVRLERWEQLADVEDDDAFRPDADDRYDLRKPSDDGAALHFVGQGLSRVIASRPKAGAYRVERVGDIAVETPLATEYLGAPVTLVA